MSYVPRRSALALCCAGFASIAAHHHAAAHAIAGDRVFPATLIIDDPAMMDEASVPTLTYLRHAADGAAGPTYETDIAGEFDKTLVPDFGVAINDGATILDTMHGKLHGGWQDLTITLKWQAYVNPEHEFMASLGIIRELGNTGTQNLGVDQVGSTTPTFYFGKGLGDLPIGVLRPLAITGTFGYTIADRELKALPGGGGGGGSQPNPGISSVIFNNGYANQWVGGLSVQYSLPYLQSEVHDYGLSPFFANMIPLVEMAYSSPAARPNNHQGTQIVFAPGVIYLANWYQVGIEALIPGNSASGSNIGAIAQFHVFFDDLYPHSLGKPLFSF